MDIKVILIVGCILPLIGWLTFIGTYINEKITGNYSSPVLIPIIGPVILNIWSLQMAHPTWAYVVPWVADISTVSFIIILPSLISEFWQYSKYTMLLSIKAKNKNQIVNL